MTEQKVRKIKSYQPLEDRDKCKRKAEEAELKPCPLCGGTALAARNYALNGEVVKCQSCGAQIALTGWRDLLSNHVLTETVSHSNVIWNTRADASLKPCPICGSNMPSIQYIKSHDWVNNEDWEGYVGGRVLTCTEHCAIMFTC